MIYIILIVVMNLAAVGVAFFLISKKQKAFSVSSGKILKELENDIGLKKSLFQELYGYARKTIAKNELQALKENLANSEKEVEKARDRHSSLEISSNTMDARLEELQELEKEFETSEAQAREELLILQDEAERMASENQELVNRLEEAMGKIDKLVQGLEQSKEAVDKLNNCKTDMLDAQSKIEFYEQDIQEVSQNIIDLKSAYDALDIEYAQLYEKQAM